MTTRMLRTFPLALCLAIVTSCGGGSSPEGICKKMIDLAKKEKPEAASPEALKQCTDKLAELQKNDKATYDKMANCISAAPDGDAAGMCMLAAAAGAKKDKAKAPESVDVDKTKE